MEQIRYYWDTQNGFLLAYERSTEFFVKFISSTGRWEDCEISFMQFMHDYSFREISANEAMEKAGECLPEANYKEYIAMLDSNLGR